VTNWPPLIQYLARGRLESAGVSIKEPDKPYGRNERSQSLCDAPRNEGELTMLGIEVAQ
jgi:hypothetical protein